MHKLVILSCCQKDISLSIDSFLGENLSGAMLLSSIGVVSKDVIAMVRHTCLGGVIMGSGDSVWFSPPSPDCRPPEKKIVRLRVSALHKRNADGDDNDFPRSLLFLSVTSYYDCYRCISSPLSASSLKTFPSPLTPTPTPPSPLFLK